MLVGAPGYPKFGDEVWFHGLGLKAHESIEFKAVIGDEPNYDVEGTLLLTPPQGPYRLHHLAVTARDDGPISAVGWRSVAVERIVSAELAKHGVEEATTEAMLAATEFNLRRVPSGADLRAAGADDGATQVVVSRVYLQALLSGGAPAEAVAKRLGSALSTAAVYIKAAKQAGHLLIGD
jgi:hypothetical protein